MSKQIEFLVIAIFLSTFLLGCGTTASVPRRVTSTTDRWAMYEIVPSRILNSNHGSTIMQTWLDDRSRLTVYRDNNIASMDRQFVYSRIMHDFGWRDAGDKWVQANSYNTPRRTVNGNMYVNPFKKMAIYFFPDNTWGVYGVRIE